MSVYSRLGVRRVVNASGIYTDLGGSCLSEEVWAAAAEANATWAAMDELLERSGERIASLVGAEAARVVPGASAGIALAVAACIARGGGESWRRCRSRTRACWSSSPTSTRGWRRSPGLARSPSPGEGAAAVLHAAHLGGEVPDAGVPVVIDAAYLSHPVSELRRWAAAGDLTCFSAKYFWGPNAGGFVAGRREAVEWVAALDFTGYESGPWRTFGRAWKLDRATVAATVAALEAWVAMDHDARWAGYERLARELAARVGGGLRRFTLDERVLAEAPFNAVVVRGAAGAEAPLAAGDPSIRAVAFGDDLVFCTEAVGEGEIAEIVLAFRRAMTGT